MSVPSPQKRPVFTIDADRRARVDRAFFRELWAYREAFRVLAWRSIKVRYKQTAIGVAWVVLRPLVLMVVLTLIFGVIAGFREDGPVPYTLLVLSGVLGWQFFSTVLVEAGNSLVVNAQIIGKVYFPRIMFPASTLFSGMFDLLISLLLFVPVMLWYAFRPDWPLLFLPFFLLLLALLALGAGLWLAALNVRYRDFGILIPFVLQVGFFLTPVAYPLTVVPEAWRPVYALNPMVGVLEGMRWSLLGAGTELAWSMLGWSVFVSLVMLLTGVRYFRRAEHAFVDLV